MLYNQLRKQAVQHFTHASAKRRLLIITQLRRIWIYHEKSNGAGNAYRPFRIIFV